MDFELLDRDGLARRGRFTTPHGVIETPALLPGGPPRPARQPVPAGRDALPPRGPGRHHLGLHRLANPSAPHGRRARRDPPTDPLRWAGDDRLGGVPTACLWVGRGDTDRDRGLSERDRQRHCDRARRLHRTRGQLRGDRVGAQRHDRSSPGEPALPNGAPRRSGPRRVPSGPSSAVRPRRERGRRRSRGRRSGAAHGAISLPRARPCAGRDPLEPLARVRGPPFRHRAPDDVRAGRALRGRPVRLVRVPQVRAARQSHVPGRDRPARRASGDACRCFLCAELPLTEVARLPGGRTRAKGGVPQPPGLRRGDRTGPPSDPGRDAVGARRTANERRTPPCAQA